MGMVMCHLYDLAPPHFLDASYIPVPSAMVTFNFLVVTLKLTKIILFQRHRLVNESLKDELASGVHALSIQVLIIKI